MSIGYGKGPNITIIIMNKHKEKAAAVTSAHGTTSTDLTHDTTNGFSTWKPGARMSSSCSAQIYAKEERD